MVDKTPRKRKPKSTASQVTSQIPKSEQCIVPNCGKPKSVRGMCNYCYQTAKRNILRGNTTWDELLTAGLALESHTKQGYLMEALRKYREENGIKPPVKRKHAASSN